MKIETIPKGWSNRKNRKQLMKENHIAFLEDFKRELAVLKKDNIILFDDKMGKIGYYRPDSERELIDFIEKCEKERINIDKLINRAKKELQEQMK